MVQIIPPGTPRQSTAQKFNMAVQSGMDMLAQQQQKKQKEEAFRNLGVDPAVANLPPEGQAAYFKQIFSPKKEETPLQAAQREKYEQQTKSSQASQRRMGNILGDTEPQQSLQMQGENPQGQMGVESPQQGQQQRKKIEDYSDEDLGHLAAYKNDPDPNNKYIANIAEQEINKRLETKKNTERKNIAQTKQVSDSYKENQDFINKTYDQYEDAERKEADIDRMNQLNDSGELSDSGIINALETLGLSPEWLKNPANEEYNKLALDLLGGGSLQADYGSRVLASEFKVSQQRIPSLMQTVEGRRQIAENIKTMLLPAKLKKERMKFYLDKQERTGDPLPHNLRGKILEDIKPQLEEAYDKFKQRNGRYKVREGTIPDDNALEKYYYLSNGDEKKAFQMMNEDGYDTKS